MGGEGDRARPSARHHVQGPGSKGPRIQEVTEAATSVPHIETLVVIGGPPLHVGYVGRLFKAETAGKITFGRIIVVDRDPACAAAGLVGDRVRLEVSSWNDWLEKNLAGCGETDHLVPYHWAPHILLDWLATDLGRRGFPLTRVADLSAPPSSPPVRRATRANDLALSYAEWLCPPACIEPDLCPHTRGPRWWSLATDLAEAPGSFVFPCLHLAYGVGAIPVSAIFEVRDRLLAGLREGGLKDRVAWVGSASHCHGLTGRVRF